MIIPKFIKGNDAIGVVALSSSIKNKEEDYNTSKEHFIKEGYKIIESNNLYTGTYVAGSPDIRAKELYEMYEDSNINAIAIARGGDFLIDMLDYFDFDIVTKYPKWIWGSSDPTSLLFIITTKYNICTIYSPCNMTGFDTKKLYPYQENFMNIIKGNLVKQYRNDYKEIEPFSNKFTKENEWINLYEDVDTTGTLLGGCIEVLKDIIGTKYDNVNNFIDIHKEGIIWYFDVFNMSSENLYKTLLQFKYAGWFKNTNLIVFGPVCFPSTEYDLDYIDMIKKVDIGKPIIYNFDLGHVKPSFTMINGMKVRIINNKNESSMEYVERY